MTPKVALETVSKGDVEYDRVSSVCNFFSPPEYVEYLLRVGKREAKRAGTVAMKFGKHVDDVIRGNKKATERDAWEVKNCLKAWEKWVNDYAPRDIAFGYRLYDEHFKITGEPDFTFGTTIVDIKCSTVIRPAYFFQLGAYFQIAKGFNKVAVLRLDKQSATYEYVESEELGLKAYECTRGFFDLLSYARIYNHLQSRLQPKERVYDSDSYD